MEKTLPKDVEIAALLPAYTQEGDVTRILLTNGTELVYRRTMRSTLAKLARRRCKDVTLLRRWASQDLDDGGLAGSGFAHQKYEFAVFYIKRDALEGLGAVFIRLHDVLQSDHTVLSSLPKSIRLPCGKTLHYIVL